MIRVFLSWSGTTSRAVAESLRDWIPNVIQEARPWLSSADITPGVRWPFEIGRELGQSDFGILCLTSDNLAAPWILFEAGALGKKLETARVVPFLFRVERSQITGPLSQFQNVEADKAGTRSLASSIYGAIAEPTLPPDRLEKAFEKWWPELEMQLSRIPNAIDQVAPPRRSQDDMLAEMLNLVRGLQRDVTLPSRAESSPDWAPDSALAQSKHSEILDDWLTRYGHRVVSRADADSERLFGRPLYAIPLRSAVRLLHSAERANELSEPPALLTPPPENGGASRKNRKADNR
jgi:hypothetical protein